MNVARDAAPEIDRLVLSVNRAVGPRHGQRLAEIARAVGLDSLDLLPPFDDFLVAGTLTRDLAVVRMRYREPKDVLGRLDEFEQKGLVSTAGGGIVPTAALRPLLGALLEARAGVAAEAWHDHDDAVAAVSATARKVALAASDDHELAVAHRALPEPGGPYLLAEHRLVTLRYVRQHDHAAAWLGRGLTAPQIVAMTRLWRGDDPGDADEALAQLSARGFVVGDPPRLTAAGADVRAAIEAETNRRAQASFDVLDDDEAATFLAALRRLPSAAA